MGLLIESKKASSVTKSIFYNIYFPSLFKNLLAKQNKSTLRLWRSHSQYDSTWNRHCHYYDILFKNSYISRHCGLAKITSSLTRLEERLQSVVNEYHKTLKSSQRSDSLIRGPVPSCMTWITTCDILGAILLLPIMARCLKYPGRTPLDYFRFIQRILKIRLECEKNVRNILTGLGGKCSWKGCRQQLICR